MGSTGIPFNSSAIPDFTISGVLPPFRGQSPTVMALMSPYRANLIQIADKMCKSDERKAIFRGLLSYRQQLASLGFTRGIQWLSGSFMEDIETLEQRPPNDIDIVTLCHRPKDLVENDIAWRMFCDSNRKLLSPTETKKTYQCDSYFVDLDSGVLNVVDQSRYWFGLFSHRRGGVWKGLLQVSLTVTQDDVEASLMVRP